MIKRGDIQAVTNGTATAADIGNGKTAFVNGKKLTGSLDIIPFPVYKTTINCKVEPIAGGDATVDQTEVSSGFTRNFYNFITATLGMTHADRDTTYGAGHINTKNTDGTTHGFDARSSYNNFYENKGGTIGAAGADYKGIVAGKGTGAESFESNTLGTIIAHGTAAGKLSYAAEAIALPTYTSATKTYTGKRSRVLSNTSGGTINVSEVGLILQYAQGTNLGFALVERTLLSSAVPVPTAYKLTISYNLEIIYPG